jgi:hypothetical protein
MKREMNRTDALLKLIGFTLLYTQLAEHIIKRCIRYFRVPGLSLEALEAAEQKERKSTLGHFLTQLRKHVEVAPDFDAKLDTFLQGRNDLVHNFFEITNIKFLMGEGQEKAYHFLKQLKKDTQHVVRVLHGCSIYLMNH